VLNNSQTNPVRANTETTVQDKNDIIKSKNEVRDKKKH
jgi:hypothetical protein